MSRSTNTDGSPETTFLLGGNEMGARMRAYDWARTSLGPAALWPQSLKTARAHHAHVAPADVRLVGRGADQPLQRRLQGDRRRQAPRGAGPAGRRWCGARSGIRSGRAPSRRMRAQRGHLRRGAAADHGAQRLPGGDLLHVLLQPGAGRRGRHRRHHLRQHRRHAAHHRRAPAGAAARAGGRRRRRAHRRGRVRALRAPRSRPTRRTFPSR